MSGPESEVPPSVTSRARGNVTPLRSYRVVSKFISGHEETLIRWWSMRLNHSDNPAVTTIAWSQVADWCHGAALALMDVRGRGHAIADFEDARALAAARAQAAAEELHAATARREGAS